MKKIAKRQKICYSSRASKMKNYLKFLFTCSLSVFCTAAFVVVTTMAVVRHESMNGQGGQDMPIPESAYMSEILGSGDESLVMDFTDDIGSDAVLSPASSDDRDLYYFSYRIKSGDMIGKIAEAYGVTQDTLISVNRIKSTRTIQPNTYLIIPSMPGILYDVVNKGETPATVAKKCLFSDKTAEGKDVLMAKANGLEDVDTELAVGYRYFVPYAMLDRWALKEINGDAFKLPLHSGFYISSNYGWRKNPFDPGRRTYHGGVDMACARGVSVYSAREGTVTTAGWSDVYGNYVIVTHGNTGYKTLYGHMSSLLVTRGQYVYTDTRIGLVGSTGMSTGPHLHFTVYKNGRSLDPKSVVSFKR